MTVDSTPMPPLNHAWDGDVWDAWDGDVGSGRAHEQAMCVLMSRGGFLGQEPWCVGGDCT